jgi:hypothetical protein
MLFSPGRYERKSHEKGRRNCRRQGIDPPETENWSVSDCRSLKSAQFMTFQLKTATTHFLALGSQRFISITVTLLPERCLGVTKWPPRSFEILSLHSACKGLVTFQQIGTTSHKSYDVSYAYESRLEYAAKRWSSLETCSLFTRNVFHALSCVDQLFMCQQTSPICQGQSNQSIIQSIILFYFTSFYNAFLCAAQEK